MAKAGFPSKELAVAETFGFSCLGFLASLLPRLLLLPLAMRDPFLCSDPVPGWQGHHCGVFRAPDLQRRAVDVSDVRMNGGFFGSFVQHLLLATGYGCDRAGKHRICSGKVFGCVNLGPVQTADIKRMEQCSFDDQLCVRHLVVSLTVSTALHHF